MSTSRVFTPYHHGDLRRALLDAAMELLEQEGLGALGFRELARRVKVSAAAPYRHFDSRASLLETIAVTGFRRFAKALDEAGATGHGHQRLNAMGEAYVGFALDNPNLFRLMFSPELEKSHRPALRMASDAAFSSLRSVVSELDGDPRITALRSWAKVHGLAVLLLDSQIALREDEDIGALVRAVISGD